VVQGGGAQFPDVDARFDVQPRHLFGPFWQLTVTDTVLGCKVGVNGGGLLTGYGSVRRAATWPSSNAENDADVDKGSATGHAEANRVRTDLFYRAVKRTRRGCQSRDHLPTQEEAAMRRREGGSTEVPPAGFIIVGCVLVLVGCWGFVAPGLHAANNIRAGGDVLIALPAGLVCIVVGVFQMVRRRR